MAVGEWDQRQLCPDGGCVGVIGPDGTCKVCGRAAPNWGDERKRGLLEPPDEAAGAEAEDDAEGDGEADGGKNDDEERDVADGHGEAGGEAEDDGEEDGDEDEAPDVPAAAAASSSDWASRALCPDGGCIGVIGPDGRCKVCGRAASESPEAAPAAVSTAEPASAEQSGAPSGAENAPPRARCSDVTCTGMSGPDGHCEVCGKVVA